MKKSLEIKELNEKYNGNMVHAPTRNSEGLNAGLCMAIIEHGTSGEGGNGETTSFSSDESQFMIIRKEIQWSIRIELKQ